MHTHRHLHIQVRELLHIRIPRLFHTWQSDTASVHGSYQVRVQPDAKSVLTTGLHYMYLLVARITLDRTEQVLQVTLITDTSQRQRRMTGWTVCIKKAAPLRRSTQIKASWNHSRQRCTFGWSHDIRPLPGHARGGRAHSKQATSGFLPAHLLEATEGNCIS